MRKILKTAAATLALIAAATGAADAKFIGRMNVSGRIDPAAATPATPAAPVTFAFEGPRSSGCNPFAGPPQDTYSESQAGIDMTATIVPCFHTPFGGFSGQASFEGLELGGEAVDIAIGFSTQVTLKSFAVVRSGSATPVTVVSSSGGSYTFTAEDYVPVTVTLPAGFTGTSFTIQNPDTTLFFIDTLVVQP